MLTSVALLLVGGSSLALAAPAPVPSSPSTVYGLGKTVTFAPETKENSKINFKPLLAYNSVSTNIRDFNTNSQGFEIKRHPGEVPAWPTTTTTTPKQLPKFPNESGKTISSVLDKNYPTGSGSSVYNPGSYLKGVTQPQNQSPFQSQNVLQASAQDTKGFGFNGYPGSNAPRTDPPIARSTTMQPINIAQHLKEQNERGGGGQHSSSSSSSGEDTSYSSIPSNYKAPILGSLLGNAFPGEASNGGLGVRQGRTRGPVAPPDMRPSHQGQDLFQDDRLPADYSDADLSPDRIRLPDESDDVGDEKGPGGMVDYIKMKSIMAGASKRPKGMSTMQPRPKSILKPDGLSASRLDSSVDNGRRSIKPVNRNKGIKWSQEVDEQQDSFNAGYRQVASDFLTNQQYPVGDNSLSPNSNSAGSPERKDKSFTKQYTMSANSMNKKKFATEQSLPAVGQQQTPTSGTRPSTSSRLKMAVLTASGNSRGMNSRSPASNALNYLKQIPNADYQAKTYIRPESPPKKQSYFSNSGSFRSGSELDLLAVDKGNSRGRSNSKETAGATVDFWKRAGNR